jgi:predicted alpha/beta superfamily hydrolase
MKNYATIFLTILIFVHSINVYASTNKLPYTNRSDVEIVVNGVKMPSSDLPIIQNGLFLLPFRSLLVSLGVPNRNENIAYNNATKVITVKSGNTAVQLTVGKRAALVNKKFVTMDVPALVHARTQKVYVPVRFLSETLNKTITWSASTKQISIKDKQSPINPNPNPTPTYVKPSGIVTETSIDGRTIIHSQFPSANLGNKRAVRVYLPASYKTNSNAKFPVVYMNDGQNVIGLGGSFGSWKTDAVANELVQLNKMREVIIVGIDNTTNRANEYNYTGSGIVVEYGKFVAEEVVPFINHEYRTLADPKNTAIIGSSYGGNSALYIGWRHSNIFGNIGVFSSTLIWNDFALLKLIQNEIKVSKKVLKLCIYVGDSEKLDEDGNGLANYAEWTIELAKLFHDNGWTAGRDLIYMIGEKSAHNEAAWAAHIDQPLRFFFGTDNNAQPASMQVKLTASDIDLGGTVSNIWAFPYLTYNTGVRTIYPAALLANNALQVVNRNFDQLTLKNRQSTSPQTLPLNYTIGSLSGSANLRIVSSPQNKVKVLVELLAPLSTVQKVHMTGDFSSWGQNINSDYILTRSGERNGKALYTGNIVLDKNKTLAFKFRAGSDWKFVEKRADGTDTLNRELKTFDRDVTATYSVERWNSTP